MSVVSLQNPHYVKHSSSRNLPPIRSNTNRFIQTHEIWHEEEIWGQPQYNTNQLTDSLVCMSMCNDIRKTLAELPPTEKKEESKPPTRRSLPARLSGSAKLEGTRLLTMAAYKKAMSQPATSHYIQRNPEFQPAAHSSQGLTLDLRLSPLNKTVGLTDQPQLKQKEIPVIKKVPDFRLPYHECLLKSKSPTIAVLEVQCLECGQQGSLYKHRADKAKCGRCGNSLAIRLDNKMQYKFKLQNKFSDSQVRERMTKRDQKIPPR